MGFVFMFAVLGIFISFWCFFVFIWAVILAFSLVKACVVSRVCSNFPSFVCGMWQWRHTTCPVFGTSWFSKNWKVGCRCMMSCMLLQSANGDLVKCLYLICSFLVWCCHCMLMWCGFIDGRFGGVVRGECGVYLNAFASNGNRLFSCGMSTLLSSLSSSFRLIWMVRGSKGPSNIMLSSSSGEGDG